MWSVTLHDDPLWQAQKRNNRINDDDEEIVKMYLVKLSCLVKDILSSSSSSNNNHNNHDNDNNNNNNNNNNELEAFQESGRAGQIALADYIIRRFVIVDEDVMSCSLLSSSLLLKNDDDFKTDDDDDDNNNNNVEYKVLLEPLDRISFSSSFKGQCQGRSQIIKKKKKKKKIQTPFIFERSDVSCTDQSITITARAIISSSNSSTNSSDRTVGVHTFIESNEMKDQLSTNICQVLMNWSNEFINTKDAMNYVATCTLQTKMREELQSSPEGLNNGVAFIANGSILPRKSGATQYPMASPPAVPFVAPIDSDLCRTITVAFPSRLRSFLTSPLINSKLQQQPKQKQNNNNNDNQNDNNQNDNNDHRDVVVLMGLLIPRGVSLIVGGGYHGKSTLLRAIGAKVYNTIPGDGREFCVTVSQALNIRAEDGRYVNNCNVSGFISNLPTPPPPPPPTLRLPTSKNQMKFRAPDTKHFSTGEASGSTSQASNVVEALELQSSCFLVDEDVSAANFMARDGRMRALVMDESITPLLYRINGLFQTHGVSSIVVVGGVGDWLDVPHHVILMEKYSCFDATAKARSISKQFSHGHVQYGGRGVVHRLEWDENEHTPKPRRPTDASSQALNRDTTSLGLLEGGFGLVFHSTHLNDGHDNSMKHDDDDDDEDDRYIDMSRCEQLLGNRPQLFGCGLATLWVLQASRKHPNVCLNDLLNMLDREIESKGLLQALAPDNSPTQRELMVYLGHIHRPRRLEVGQALCRLRGIQFEELPIVEDPIKLNEKAEEERKKRELMELWNARRK